MEPYQVAIVLSEIMYHPLPSATPEERTNAMEPSDFEFIELYHRGDEALPLEPLTLRGGVRFDFGSADRQEIRPDERLLLVRNRQAFLARYPEAAGFVLGEWEDGKLSNGGERIAVGYGKASTVVSLDYDDKAPWPREADGKGHSLEWTDVEKPAHDPSAWRAREEVHGSPGR
jgi:hypothetical protein